MLPADDMAPSFPHDLKHFVGTWYVHSLEVPSDVQVGLRLVQYHCVSLQYVGVPAINQRGWTKSFTGEH